MSKISRLAWGPVHPLSTPDPKNKSVCVGGGGGGHFVSPPPLWVASFKNTRGLPVNFRRKKSTGKGHVRSKISK